MNKSIIDTNIRLLAKLYPFCYGQPPFYLIQYNQKINEGLIMSIIGQQIKKYRIENGFTQEQVGKK